MTVGFDVSWMNVENRSGGVYHYALRLITAMVEHSDVKVVAIIGLAGRGIFDHLKEYDNFNLALLDSSHTLLDIVQSQKIDIIHTPIQYHYNYTLAIPMISTLHDLQPFHYPEFFTEEEIQFRNTYYKKSAEFSELVIVSYQHVKDDIIKFYGIPAEKIAVCPLGMPVPKKVDQSLFSVLKEKYHLPDKYLFYSANTWRHKNHAGLLKALKFVHERYENKITLVCTGYKIDDYFPELQKLINELDLSKYVIFTGYVPDEDLLLLLTNATLVVIPTLYEAGSFPLMDAMAYNVPVICSNVTSLPGTIGDSRFTFDPSSADQMAERIAVMFTDKNMMHENRVNSQKRFAEVDWGKVVEKFVDTYVAAVDRFKHTREQSFYSNWLLNYEFFLDESARKLRRSLEESEADRAARLDVIHSYQQQLQETQQQFVESEHRLQESQQQLQASEQQLQEARQQMQVTQQGMERVQQQLLDSEADRAARLEAIYTYQHQLHGTQQQLQETQQRLQETRQLDNNGADRAAQQDVIQNLQRQLESFVTYRAAIKTIIFLVSRKLGIYKFLKRHESFFYSIYHSIRNFWVSSASSGKTASSAANEGLAINSTLVEAFIVARTLEGDTDDKTLVYFYELGSTRHNILSISPSDNDIQALYMLAKAGSNVVCVFCTRRQSELQAYGFTVAQTDLAGWMGATGQAVLVYYQSVFFGPDIDEDFLFLLKGRLLPTIKIFVDGQTRADALLKRWWGEPSRTVSGFNVYDTPPEDWCDPTPGELMQYNQIEWPMRSKSIKAPLTLPSGNKWPKISVITVTYNQGDYLEETIRSVLLQGYPNLEYIVIDGGSTDNTKAILDRYKNELSHCISERDNGQSDALNKGFRLATGDILAWLNSDDRYLPWTLWRVAHAFDTYNTDIVAGGCALVHRDDKVPFRTHHNAMPLGRVVPLPLERLLDVDRSWQKGDFFYQPEVFWSRAIWERSGGRVNEKLFYSMDYELWLRMAQNGARIVHIPDTLAVFRIHERQKTSDGDLPFLPELRRVNAEFKEGLKQI